MDIILTIIKFLEIETILYKVYSLVHAIQEKSIIIFNQATNTIRKLTNEVA